MLDQLVRHGDFDLQLNAIGDLEIDAHHTVEDIGIILGEAFNSALGDKKGIKRFGSAYAPLDESLSRVVVDFSGRPGLFWDVEFKREFINDFDLQLLEEFFHGFTNKALATIHVDNLKGANAHHQAETIFKAFALALKQACSMDDAKKDRLPSTKELL
jgi:imidazoleglycerol-phosphate dehydratase